MATCVHCKRSIVDGSALCPWCGKAAAAAPAPANPRLARPFVPPPPALPAPRTPAPPPAEPAGAATSKEKPPAPPDEKPVWAGGRAGMPAQAEAGAAVSENKKKPYAVCEKCRKPMEIGQVRCVVCGGRPSRDKPAKSNVDAASWVFRLMAMIGVSILIGGIKMIAQTAVPPPEGQVYVVEYTPEKVFFLGLAIGGGAWLVALIVYLVSGKDLYAAMSKPKEE